MLIRVVCLNVRLCSQRSEISVSLSKSLKLIAVEFR